MKISQALSLLSFALLTSLHANAHEFWISANPFTIKSGTETRISFKVGEDFTGVDRPTSQERTASLKLYAKKSVQDLALKIPHFTDLPELVVDTEKPGTYVIAYDSIPNEKTLEAEKFNAYLIEDGLDAVLRHRKKTKTDTQPAHERYRRNVKAIIQTGNKTNTAYQTRTQQRFEILPLSHPKKLKSGELFKVQLFFDNKPLAGALVRAWHKGSDQTYQLKMRSNSKGKAHFQLPYAGVWMISAVHMIAVNDDPNFNWDSFWANLTFEL